MKLYYFETPNGHKACAVAKYLDSGTEFVHVDLRQGEHKKPDFLSINPNGRIPALVDGDRRLWESTAIMVYLAQKAGSDLWPSDEKQIDVLKWMTWDVAHFSRHAGTLVFNNIIKKAFNIGEPNAEAVEEATGFFRQFAAVLDAQLAQGAYVVGDALTLADFSIAAFLPNYSHAGIPIEEFPNVKDWNERMLAIPAWREPFAPGS